MASDYIEPGDVWDSVNLEKNNEGSVAELPNAAPDRLESPAVSSAKAFAQDYLADAKRTASYPPKYAIEYLSLGLSSEAGELAGEVKRILRDDDCRITEGRIERITSELGDVMWYVIMLCYELDIGFDDVIAKNIRKLVGRKLAGTIKGNGDNR